MQKRFENFKLRLFQAAERFAKDTTGAALVEMAISLPFLVLLFCGALVMQDAIRMSYLQSKATYTVSDMISREDALINVDYFDGLNSIYRYLVGDDYPTELRISIIECTADCEVEADRVLDVCWSQPSTGLTELTTADIVAYRDRTPLFSAGDTLIMTEAFLDYTPLFGNRILSPRTYETLAYTRPRIVGQIKFDTGMTDASGNAIVKDCFNN